MEAPPPMMIQASEPEPEAKELIDVDDDITLTTVVGLMLKRGSR